MGNSKLTGWIDGVRSEVKRNRVEAMPGREGRVGFPQSDVVEGEFDVREEFRPAVRGERDMTGGQDRENVVFGGAYSTLRRKGAMVVWGNILIGNKGREEKGGKVGGGLIV